MLIRAEGTADLLPTPGQLIAAWDDATFTAITIRLDPGDTLLLYTDGLTEARTDSAGGRYGDDALRTLARNLAPTTAAAAVVAVTVLLESFSDGLDDDTAILALSVPLPQAAVTETSRIGGRVAREGFPVNEVR
jgi:sigma-B regulation protein RsbU (phosphoserine phosphatase)